MNRFNLQAPPSQAKEKTSRRGLLANIKPFSNHLSIGLLAFLGWILWWSPNYFEPETFMNLGDSVFPFSPEKFLWEYYYIWYENGKDAHGYAEGYHAGIITLYYYFLVKAQALGLPLWVLNRLFFLIPTWLFLFASYYFILSFNWGRFKYFSAALCAFFLVTAPPQTVIAPRPTLALAGFVLSFACIQRYLIHRNFFHLFLFGIACVFMTSMPRYAFLTLILAPVYVIIWGLLSRGTANSLNTKEFFKATGIILIASLGLNAYTLFPTFSFLIEHSSAEIMISPEQYNLRTNEVINFYKDQTHPIYTLRMIVNNPYSTHTLYFSNPFLVGFSFTIPLLIGIGIIFGRKYINVLAMGFLFLLTTSLSISFGNPFYNWLYKNIPGFWILNNPHFLQAAASLPAAVFLFYALSEVDLFIACKTKGKKIFKRFIWALAFILILVTYNAAYIFDWVPKHRRIFTGGDLTNQAMGNHLPYFRVPEEYWELARKLKHDRPRILVLPTLRNGYMRYSWHKEAVMPEIMEAISPYRIAGHAADQTQPLRLVLRYIMEGNETKALATFSRYNYEYVFLHKDRLPASSYDFQEEYVIAAHFLKGWDLAELVEDNKYFSLYKIQNQK